MDIREKLRLSEASHNQVQWFREGKHVRLYQGALYWAQQQGLPAKLECRTLKSLPGGCLIYGEFNEELLLHWLHECRLTPVLMSWGWCVNLPQPRCSVRERAWLETQIQHLPTRRWRPIQDESFSRDEQVKELLGELLHWPTDELSPMQALKAIRRWQGRLQQVSGHPAVPSAAGCASED